MTSDQKALAQRGDVLSIYAEFLTGSPTCVDVWEWLDRAKAAGEPRSTESTLLLQELLDHLTAPGMDPDWHEVGTHAVFQIRVFGGPNNTGIITAAATVAGMTVTAAVLPFLQSLATQAGQRAFEAARATSRRMISRYAADAPAIHRRAQVVVEETAAGLRFIVPPRLPDTALAALASTDLEALAAPAEASGTVTIYWDEEAEQWRRHVTNG
ncbi:hypothetical protein OIU91_20365 [Streptomyces sp. NBC_01456]|uniref:hypothetical protein n=1 Tax=unclassified Streptomyces TaxID=2593676 RepID=UPI002E378897|nr:MULTISPECIES: hypothetical protein [unclassified Streptomyces]